MNAPKNAQPSSEWISTRVLKVWKPSAYRQCTATGTASRNAIRPDHRCSPPIHGGAWTLILPYITRAEITWMMAAMNAPVASQALADCGPEKPARLTAIPVGWWMCP